jgi:MerR family transcriptional regulator, light-induced transcriptional regulator
VSNDGLSAGAAARRLGVAVTTLRTWHQRYGLGPSRHEPGHHRRYTVEDMVRLQVMQRLTAQGVAPAEAAAWARRSPAASSPSLPLTDSADPVRQTGAADARESILSLAESSTLITDVGLGDARAEVETIALGPRVDPAARALARAAMCLHSPSMRYILESAVTRHGVIFAWTNVMMPVLIGIGERYAATERFIEVEHLLSRSITEALSTVPRPPHEIDPRVLLAATDQEQHTLPLEALAAALAEHGVPSRLLGPRLPPRALLNVVERTGPAVVVLWSQLPGSGDVTQLASLLSLPLPPLLVAAAGPGWTATDLPPTVTPLSGLAEGVRVVTAAIA